MHADGIRKEGSMGGRIRREDMLPPFHAFLRLGEGRGTAVIYGRLDAANVLSQLSEDAYAVFYFEVAIQGQEKRNSPLLSKAPIYQSDG
jgi:hypothetical protein